MSLTHPTLLALEFAHVSHQDSDLYTPRITTPGTPNNEKAAGTNRWARSLLKARRLI